MFEAVWHFGDLKMYRLIHDFVYVNSSSIRILYVAQ